MSKIKNKSEYKKIFGNEYRGIEKKILILIHLKNRNSFLKTQNIKNEVLKLSKFFSKNTLEWLYSLKDKYGSHFDHQIRNARTYLAKNNYIFTRNSNSGPYIANLKLLNSFKINDLKKSVNSFAISVKDYWLFFNKNKKIKSLPKEEYIKKVEESNLIKSLRSSFSKKLKKDCYVFLENIDFEFPEAAHIIPVWWLAKNNRYDDIKNPNNGLLLDPNTHVLIDRKKIIIEDNKIICEKMTIKIKEKHINSERKKFINERRFLIKNKTI